MLWHSQTQCRNISNSYVSNVTTKGAKIYVGAYKSHPENQHLQDKKRDKQKGQQIHKTSYPVKKGFGLPKANIK